MEYGIWTLNCHQYNHCRITLRSFTFVHVFVIVYKFSVDFLGDGEDMSAWLKSVNKAHITFELLVC